MRYHFHIRIDGDLIFDHEGIELENNQLAREEAIKSAAELMREYLQNEKRVTPQSISVTDEANRELFIVPINSR